MKRFFCKDDLPHPGKGDIIQLEDSDIASYIEFPEDTFFLESIAHNKDFRPGVGYVPAQRVVTKENGKKVTESHLYEIRPGMTKAKHLCGPLASADGVAVTVFGSALTREGLLYLCAFNRNSIMVYDLNKEFPEIGTPYPCKLEVDGLAAPNAVAIDPDDDCVMYVAGGTFTTACCCCLTFSNAAAGKVYKVRLSKDKTKVEEIIPTVTGLNTVAGIEVVNGQVWIAQLFDMLLQEDKSKDEVKEVWKGHDGNGRVWLADNVDIFDDRLILCPAYSTVPAIAVRRVLKRNYLSSAASFMLQVVSAIMSGENIGKAIMDPEVALSFSSTFIKKDEPDPKIKILFQSFDTKDVYHFEVDLVETRANHEPYDVKDLMTGKYLGRRQYFNDQVTHAAHLKDENGKGYIACVSFESPRILFLDDEPFMKATTQNAKVF